jgi:hypothetical protein
MTTVKGITTALFFVLLTLVSCEQEKKITEGDIIGRWEVYQGERGGKATQTLNGAYFEFMAENQLYTDILGENIMTGYNIYDNIIVQQGGEKIRYNIEAFDGDKMTLSAQISGADFVLDLVKSSSL